MNNIKKHTPVLVDEVLNFLKPKKNGIYLDATFGQGGYSKKILENTHCKVVAIDRDEDSIFFAEKVKMLHDKNFFFKNEKFSNINNVLDFFNKKNIDGITFDLGLSNTQIDKSQRGFSFKKNGPLDMRMGMNSNKEMNAELIINDFSEEDLKNIFFKYGEEKNSYKIAKEIVTSRKEKKIETTKELSEIIKKVSHFKRNQRIDPATKVFQALRIYVNNELIELEKALEKSLMYLNKKSRIVVVSFHSLEDKIVKKFFRENSGYFINNYKHLPFKNEKIKKPQLKILTKKTIRPSPFEIKKNPRARSAKLRAAEKI